MRTIAKKSLMVRSLIVALALMVCAESSWAVLGVWRRTAVRTEAVVATTTTAAAASASAAASQQAAAAQQQQAAQQTAAAEKQAAAAQQQAAAAQQQAAVAQQQAAAATTAKSPQQQLEELQGLYKQGLISESDYNTAKAKVLAQMTK
jgi:hypothetical protein